MIPPTNEDKGLEPPKPSWTCLLQKGTGQKGMDRTGSGIYGLNNLEDRPINPIVW